MYDTFPMALSPAQLPPLPSHTPLTLPRGLLIERRWRVRRRIGSGGVASVFEADELPGAAARVALKVVHPAWAALDEVRARFAREVSVLERAASPRVVALRGRGVVMTAWGALPCLAMELCAGRTVAAILDAGPLEPKRAARLLAGALLAVADVHARGVVHRDLKPENLLVEEEPPGAPARIKLIDFGLSRALGDGPVDRLTRVGFTVGTPSYMAPEQALGDPAADHRIDLFSLGVVLYEMLTGRLPFDGESNTVVLARVLAAAPRPPRELRPSIPCSLEAVVLRALDKEPARRFDGAEAMAAAVLEAHDGDAPSAPLAASPART